MTLFQHHLLALFFTFLTLTPMGLFVLWKNPRRNLNRSMAFYCFSLAWWSGWECVALQMPSRHLTTQLFRVEYLGVAFIPTLLCTTVTFLLNVPRKHRKQLLVPLYFGSLVTLFPASIFPTSKFLVASSNPVAYLPIFGQAGPYYSAFLVFFFATVFISFLIIFRRWRIAAEDERTRLALFLIGSIIAYVGGCPEFALKYRIRLGWLNPFGLYGIPIYIGMVTYAIVQHRFLDIHVAIRRSLIYSLLVTSLTVSYFGLVYAVEHVIQVRFGYRSLGISVMAFAVMALIFQPLKIAIQRLVDWLLFRTTQEGLIKRMERFEQETRQTEKLKAVATLAAGMAHEIKNPLSSIKTFAEYLPTKYDDPEFRDKFTRIMAQEVDKMNAMVQRLLEFAKPMPPQPQPVRLSQLIDETLEFLQGALLNKRATVLRTYAEDHDQVLADRGQMRQVFLNVLLNSLEAMDDQGTIAVETAGINSHVKVVIRDTGRGIAKDGLSRVFDPFYTTKPSGTGLGLSVVHSIIKEHGGSIGIDSQPGKGTRVKIELPAHRGPELKGRAGGANEARRP